MPEIPSFDQVNEALSEPLRRYLGRMTGSSASADDLLQETLLKIARGLPRFEGRSSVKTWAFSIATRAAVDHLRKPENRLAIVPVEEPNQATPDAVDIEQRAIAVEMSACIRDVIDSLPEDYRAALILHDLEGWTAAETAQAIECSLAAAKIRIHRARVRLRDALQAECSFYRDRADVLRCDRKASSE